MSAIRNPIGRLTQNLLTQRLLTQRLLAIDLRVRDTVDRVAVKLFGPQRRFIASSIANSLVRSAS